VTALDELARRRRFAAFKAAVKQAEPMSQEDIDAYLASPEAERDYQEALRALREHREDQVAAAIRERADELGAMTPPGTGTSTRSRERRDSGGGSRRSGSDSSDPDEPEPHPLAAGAGA